MRKGVTIEVEGGRYMLAFTTGAQVAYEEEFSEPFTAVAERFGEDRVKEMRVGFVVKLFAIGLRGGGVSRGEITESDAMEIMDQIGGVTGAMAKIGEAISLAYPVPDGAQEGKPGNAGKGKAQTGPS